MHHHTRAVYQALLDATGKLAAGDLAAITGVPTRRVQGILAQLSVDSRIIYRLPQQRTDAPTVHVWWLSPTGRAAVSAALRASD